MEIDVEKLSSNWKKLQETLRPKEQRKKKNPHRATQQHPSKVVKHKGVKPSATKARGSSNHARKLNHSIAPIFPSETHTSQVSVADPLAPTTTRTADKVNGGLTAGLEPGKHVAIDCEMVGVGSDPANNSVLARVSLVDFNGDQVYDSYVKPIEVVTDYRTQWSGITPDLLSEARSFEEVQRDVSNLIEGRVLVGHAIQNDLAVLMLSHPRSHIRDTSNHRAYRDLFNGRRPALRHLAKQLLGLEIQGGQHSSVEDARVTMLLFRRDKAAFEGEGTGFGEPSKASSSGQPNKQRGTHRTGKSNKNKKRKK